MAPRSKKVSSKKNDFFGSDDIPVLSSKSKRRGAKKRAVKNTAVKRAAISRSDREEFMPEMHTMPSAHGHRHKLWEVELSRQHEEWLALLISVVVITCGAWFFMMCPGFFRGVGIFLHPWDTTENVSLVYTPKTTHFSTAFVISPAQLSIADGTFVQARAVETDVVASGSFPATGSEIRKDAFSSGSVKIVNTTNRAFTFVKTTRVLSKDGVLFRLSAPVVIAPQKTVVAQVVADQSGPKGDIGASTFTIPGLSADLQDEVYAVSDAAMTGGDGQAAVVTEVDIASAKKVLIATLEKEAEEDFRALVGADERLLADLVTSKELSFIVPKVGTAASSFEAKLTSRYRALLFPEAPAEQLLLKKYGLFVATQGKDTSQNLDIASSEYFVQAYDVSKDQAEVRIEGELSSETVQQ